MIHLLAHATTIAAVGPTNETPVPDGIFSIQNGFFMPQRNVNLLWAYANGLLRDQSIITTASIQQYSPVQVRPINLAAEPLSRPPYADYRNNPLLLKGQEAIQVASVNSATTSGVYHTLLQVADAPIRPVGQGDIYTMRGTAATTLVANAWTLLAVTWASNLPAGRYAAVGISGVTAGGIALRLVFEDTAWRPGGICLDIEGDEAPAMQLKGGCGILGEFTGNRMPNVEMLSISADTAEVVYLDFMRIG